MLQKLIAGFSGLLVLIGLYLSSLYSYLLFHTLAEVFSIVIACGIFMVAWNCRRYLDNQYLLFIGIAYLFVSILDLVHTFAFKGMPILHGLDANAPTQLWIAARYLESLTLLAAPLMLRRRIHAVLYVLGYGVIVLFLLLSILYWRIFPDCFLEEAGGLTPFKKISEYVISLILLASGAILIRYRSQFDPQVLRWLLTSIGLTILSELAFTTYASVYGFSNMLGHYFKILSYYFIYKAIIQTGLTKPYEILFRDLNRSREWLRTTLTSIGDAVIAAGTDGRVTFMNKVAEKLTGWSLVDALGRPAGEVFHIVNEHTRAAQEDPMSKALQSGLVAGLAEDTVLLRKAGGEVPIDDSGAPIRDEEGRILGAVLVFRDITERKRSEEALRELNATLERKVAERTDLAEARARKLQALAVELIEAEERERKRVAGLLHDDLQQMLAAARMQLATACERLAPQPLLANVERLLAESISKTRSLSRELSPGVLQHSSLAAALEWLARQMSAQFGLHVEVESDAAGQLESAPVKVFLFRALQELLFNVVKHAGVKTARVVLSGANGCLAITVSDQGRGFDPGILDSAVLSAGIGLLSLRERARHIGGDLVIESGPGQGSRFMLTVPINIAKSGG